MIPTIFMGLNTDPHFELPEKFKEFNENLQKSWERNVESALKLRDEITTAFETNDAVKLSWECTGRTRHQMHAENWEEALPQYHFIIGYNYECYVFKTREKLEEFRNARNK